MESKLEKRLYTSVSTIDSETMSSAKNSNRHIAKFKSDMIEFNKENEKKRVENDAVQLCKAIKNDRLLRRNLDMEQELIDLMYKATLSTTSDLSVDQIINYINSPDKTLQLLAIQTYTKLKRETNSSINDMIEDGILSRCIELLDCDNVSLQFQIASLLTTITSDTSKQMKYITMDKIIPKLVKLFKSAPIVVEQAVRALGNIIENKSYVRRLVLQYDALLLLANFIKSHISVTFMDDISWLLSNLCQKNPPLTVELIKPVLSVFNCLFNNKNQYIISDVCRTLSYLTDGSKDNVQAIIETADILPKLLECLTLRKETIVLPALRTLGNIVTIGNDAQKNNVIFAGGLSRLGAVLRYYLCAKEDDIVKEAFWAIFKIIDNMNQIQSIINDEIKNLLPSLIEGSQFLSGDAQKIATWTIIALITQGTIQHLIQLVYAGVLQAFCNLLKSDDNQNIINALIGMAEILHATEKIGQTEKLATMIKKFGGLEKINDLQYHENERIYRESLAIINAYFRQREARVKGVALSVELKAEEDDRLSNCNLNIKQVLPNLLNENVTFTYSLSVENIVNYIYSSDETLQLVAIHNYIDLLNKTIYDGSINDLVNDDIVSRSIELLDNHHNCRLQIEIIRVLIFMSLGTFKQMQSIIKYGAIPKLVKLLNSTEHYITQDIVISLGNIIKNRPYARDIALSHAILPRLAKLINSKISMIFTRHVVRTMFHVCKKSNPPLSFEMIKPVLPVFSYLLTIPNQSIISNTCWILAYLTEGCENNTRSLLGTGILPQVLGCLMCKEKNIFRPALRTIAHIVELGNIYETNAVISAGGLSHLCTFLRNHYMDEDIVVEIVSAIYKMVNTKEQIQCVISAGLLPLLIKILQFGEEEARHIVAWTVMDIIAEGSIEQLNELLNAGLLSIFYNLLEANDHNIVINALDCLIEILRAAEKVGQMEKFITMIKDAGILDKMETIQYQHDDLIYEVYSNTHAFLRGIEKRFLVKKNPDEQNEFELKDHKLNDLPI